MNPKRITKLIFTGAAAAVIAAPVGYAAGDRVQVAGSLVAPGQVSAAQLAAGHDPATRLVQVGGALVAPSNVSAYENAVAGTPARAGTDSSAGIGTGGIAAVAVLGAFWMIVAASMVVFRHRRKLATAC